MSFEEIILALQELPVDQKRSEAEDYFEAVFLVENEQQWDDVLSDLLGEPLKVSGQKPAKYHKELTKELGGIWEQQTLFYREIDSLKILAMFWPWSDKTHITLKIIKN